MRFWRHQSIPQVSSSQMHIPSSPLVSENPGVSAGLMYAGGNFQRFNETPGPSASCFLSAWWWVRSSQPSWHYTLPWEDHCKSTCITHTSVHGSNTEHKDCDQKSSNHQGIDTRFQDWLWDWTDIRGLPITNEYVGTIIKARSQTEMNKTNWAETLKKKEPLQTYHATVSHVLNMQSIERYHTWFFFFQSNKNTPIKIVW